MEIIQAYVSNCKNDDETACAIKSFSPNEDCTKDYSMPWKENTKIIEKWEYSMSLPASIDCSETAEEYLLAFERKKKTCCQLGVASNVASNSLFAMTKKYNLAYFWMSFAFLRVHLGEFIFSQVTKKYDTEYLTQSTFKFVAIGFSPITTKSTIRHIYDLLLTNNLLQKGTIPLISFHYYYVRAQVSAPQRLIQNIQNS